MFGGGNRTITGLPNNGGVVSLQAKAWETLWGSTYEQVLFSPQGWLGKGPIFEMNTKDPTDTLPPPTVGNAAGWQGFCIGPVDFVYGGFGTQWCMVPEPSTLTFAIVGGCFLLFFRSQRR